MPARKKKIRKKDKKEEVNVSLKEKMAEVLELPKEVVLDVPKFTMIGRTSLVIENYKGIVEYDNDRIRVNTGMGIVKILGKMLIIKEITSEDIIVGGQVCSIEIQE